MRNLFLQASFFSFSGLRFGSRQVEDRGFLFLSSSFLALPSFFPFLPIPIILTTTQEMHDAVKSWCRRANRDPVSEVCVCPGSEPLPRLDASFDRGDPKVYQADPRSNV